MDFYHTTLLGVEPWEYIYFLNKENKRGVQYDE
jgi:hypothetical protein